MTIGMEKEKFRLYCAIQRNLGFLEGLAEGIPEKGTFTKETVYHTIATLYELTEEAFGVEEPFEK